ncbi:MAG: aspartate--ammonia ligase [Odoribacter sp.]|nr:aspartate--ammonia ligase [Odoribacter sp.]
MEHLFLPQDYKPLLDVWQTEHAIKFVKDTFQLALASELKLRRITALIIVASGTGLNDNLNGIEAPVSFSLKMSGLDKAEIVQSLAKWKRYALWRHHIQPGMGIYTDMNALRPDEITDNIHSIYVDQWDWEKVITREERTVERLFTAVRRIYAALKRTEFLVSERFPVLAPFLPEEIHFIHAEELRRLYPDKTPKERENSIAKEYGAVFICGIGGELEDGTIHDGRSPDYDDWSSENEAGYKGLNGDIVIWNPVLQSAFEISSMGIRVDEEALARQLQIANCEERGKLYFHSLLLEGQLPQTMGGGIGQSRLCMLLLQKCHIGEVQAAVWSPEVIKACEKAGVFLF